jgi:excisionase family DNA binding protein
VPANKHASGEVLYKGIHMKDDELSPTVNTATPEVHEHSHPLGADVQGGDIPGSAPSTASGHRGAETPYLSPEHFSCRLAFSVRETAEILGVSEKTVRRLVSRGLLRPSRALRHLLIPKKEIERFLKTTSEQ